MKRRPSISHDEAMAKELRENPEFAVEYLSGQRLVAEPEEACPRVFPYLDTGLGRLRLSDRSQLASPVRSTPSIRSAFYQPRRVRSRYARP